MKLVLCIFVAALLGISYAQGDSESADQAADSILDNPTDISTYLERFSEGVPTVADVRDVKEKATTAFNAGNCEQAIPLLDAMATQSNTLANLMRETLTPFYDGGYDEKENFNISSVEELIENETLNNEFIRDRNSAWVMLGECELKSNNNDRAVGYFLKALDYISLDTEELDNWKRAAKGVMQITGMSTP